MAHSQGVAYQGGHYLPISEATIPLLDPAFIKSDVVFDAVSVWDSDFFRLDDHMARFRQSVEYVHMTLPFSDDAMKRIAAQCVHRTGLSAALVYMLCLRGQYPAGAPFGDLRLCEQEFVACAIPYYSCVPEDCAQTGAHLWIAQTRRAPNAAINQRCKNFNRMDLTRAQFEALDAGADQPVLLSVDGLLTEGPGFNVWIVRDNTALTPGDNLLEGITRLTVFDLCQQIGFAADAAQLRPEELQHAEEAFLSSSAGGIYPVTTVNGRRIGNGTPGRVTCQLRDLYWKKRAGGWHATPVDDLLQIPTELPSQHC
ncbi:MAG: branched-chain amino acid--2-keto-4-methylthiobutyrate aminotransferase [Planctomycetaceae bacterium]|jgi:branched-chain amino acid aminotransferase|nr:branched-chain amino acid--2-keto-4-methylthiobutyrate aminotransferase [Planctomycetaceae bacterium]